MRPIVSICMSEPSNSVIPSLGSLLSGYVSDEHYSHIKGLWRVRRMHLSIMAWICTSIPNNDPNWKFLIETAIKSMSASHDTAMWATRPDIQTHLICKLEAILDH
jgi:hypothetical protein